MFEQEAYEINKEMIIEMGHRLPNHSGKCSSVHGHSYKLNLFVQSAALSDGGSTEGMVMDYAAMKAAMSPIDLIFDHALVLCVDDPFLPNLMVGDHAFFSDYIREVKQLDELYFTFAGKCGIRVVLVRKPPTAEVLGSIWMQIIANQMYDMRLNTSWKISKLVVHETQTSGATVRFVPFIAEHLLSYKDKRIA